MDGSRPRSVSKEERYCEGGRDEGGSSDEIACEGEDNDAETIKEKTQPQSTPRQAIEAAITTAVGSTFDSRENGRPPAEKKKEDRGEIRRDWKEILHEGKRRNQCLGDDRNRSGELCGRFYGEGDGVPVRPLGKPPLVPPRDSRCGSLSRWGNLSIDIGEGDGMNESGCARREQSWNGDNDVDEVQTEAASNGSGDPEELWGDEEHVDNSVWEEDIPLGGWDEEENVLGGTPISAGGLAHDGVLSCSEAIGRNQRREIEEYRKHEEEIKDWTDGFALGDGESRPGGVQARQEGLDVRSVPRPSKITIGFTPNEGKLSPAVAGVYSGGNTRNLSFGPCLEGRLGVYGDGGGGNGGSGNNKSEHPTSSTNMEGATWNQQGRRKWGRKSEQEGKNSPAKMEKRPREREYSYSFESLATLPGSGEDGFFGTGVVRKESSVVADYNLLGEEGLEVTGEEISASNDILGREYDGANTREEQGYGRRETENSDFFIEEGRNDDSSYDSHWSLSEEDESHGLQYMPPVCTKAPQKGSHGGSTVQYDKDAVLGQDKMGENGDSVIAISLPEYEDDFVGDSAKGDQGMGVAFATLSRRCRRLFGTK